MTEYLRAREALPNIPEEAFSLWLDGRIKACGWPPYGKEWQNFLCNYPLDFWQNLHWRKDAIPLTYNMLAPVSQEHVRGLIDTNINGNRNAYTEYIPDSEQRFKSIMRYVLENKALPGTLVLLAENGLYQVIEGCHRVSVLVAMQQFEGSQPLCPPHVTAWVGYIPDCHFGS